MESGSVKTPIGTLWTSEKSAEKLGIPEKRLLELANSDIAPHHHIDNGPPVFFFPELKEWASKNLVKHHHGSGLPPRLIISAKAVIETPKYDGVPEEIRPLYEYLGEYTTVFYPTCVYFLCHNGQVVYVGQTVNLSSRIGTHLDSKDFDKVYYLPVARCDLDVTEKTFIKALKPPLNNENYKHSEDCPEEKEIREKYGFIKPDESSEKKST